MNQVENARRFAALHVPGNPLILYNIWDAGGARVLAEAGAKAIATGSWSVAGAQGYKDGEAIPLDLLETIVKRIVATVDVPVTVDFEGAYAEDPAAAAENVARIVEAGAVGINFEDQVVGKGGLHAIDRQADRIEAIRGKAEELRVPLFINARTDLFLQAKDQATHADLIDEAKARAAAYSRAGADGFFVPGLVDEPLIADLCDTVDLPVNIMWKDGVPSVPRLAEAGVARISHGAGPFFALMNALKKQAAAALGTDAG